MDTITATESFELQTRPSASKSTPQILHPTSSNVEINRAIGRTLGTSTKPASNARAILTVFQLCMINFLSSFTNGIITVGLPTIAQAISLPRSLYLWPSSVYGLTSGATLLLAGSVADLIGPRRIEVLGCVMLSAFMLACGFANTGIQLVVFRALQGVAMSLHLPASVALVAAAVPQGRGRNLSFGCLGLSQPLGFSAGLVVSGFMIEKAGWRSGFYLVGGASTVATMIGMWALPTPSPEHQETNVRVMLHKLREEVDWIGGILASTGLALLSYVLALLSADLSSLKTPSTACLLALSVVSLLAFPWWMRRREMAGKHALIPNALWRKVPFTSTCIMVALSYGYLNAMELFSSLYFQEVQNTSTLFTSLRLLPNLLVGATINLTVGMFVDKVSVRWLVSVSSFLSIMAPLMMAVVNPSWNYFYMEFWAQGLAPLSGDVLFTVGILIVSDEFPEKTQALAGAVFNTVAQFGMSLGIGVCQVVALAVSSHGAHGNDTDSESSEDVLRGFRASFWTMFAFMVTVLFVGIGGLRKAGAVGVKRD
jgi:MFS family permease